MVAHEVAAFHAQSIDRYSRTRQSMDRTRVQSGSALSAAPIFTPSFRGVLDQSVPNTMPMRLKICVEKRPVVDYDCPEIAEGNYFTTQHFLVSWKIVFCLNAHLNLL